ncbi:hypothetical protein [Herbidospora yilanensis]|nr:hypothetical protein [Herbidospora yilanensis]
MQENQNGGIPNYGSLSLGDLMAMSVQRPALDWVLAEGEPVARFQSSY